jgi:hypothetical protein
LARGVKAHWGFVTIVVGACLWFGGAPNADSAPTSKMEVRLVELASTRGPGGGLKVRLTLVGGQALEYVPEDGREADALLRMTDMFVSGRARMFAELDGANTVRAIQIAGPSQRQAP